MDETFTVGQYLGARFEQIGLKHYFVVPGDYNLILLDELLRNKHLDQIGCCNELNAAYAAEGYARVNGCGAVVTTFNVGAFSALNGVAGAYAEDQPIIFVSSGYNTNDPGANHYLHHTLGTHDHSYQYEIFRRVTCSAVRILNAENAPALIDEAITTALGERKPCYIEIACNLSSAPCSQPIAFSTPLAATTSNPEALTVAAETAGRLFDNAERPLLLAGVQLRAFGAIEAFRALAETVGCAVAVMPNAKGFFPEDHPQYIGVYWGGVSTPRCEAIVDWADLVLAAGPVFTDYTTVGWTAQPAVDRLVNAGPHHVIFPEMECTGVQLHDFLVELTHLLQPKSATLEEYRRMAPEVGSSRHGGEGDRSSPLTLAELWNQIEQALDGDTTLLVETGDSWLNGVQVHLPDGARFEIAMQWGSIGWSVPASFGYAMGLESHRRVVVVIGDGSFQMTAQEVANMIRHRQRILMILVNNHGYVVESEIHDGPYNYIKDWDYASLIAAWNSDDGDGLGLKVGTSAELNDALHIASTHTGGPVLIECDISHDDCSPHLLKWGSTVARANARPPLIG